MDKNTHNSTVRQCQKERDAEVKSEITDAQTPLTMRTELADSLSNLFEASQW